MRSMGALPLVSDGGRRRFVDKPAGREALERERRIDRMRLVAGDCMGEHVYAAWRRLEPAGSPAAIQVEAWNRGFADDRGAIGRDIDDPAPFPKHPHPGEDRKDLAYGGERVLDERQA